MKRKLVKIRQRTKPSVVKYSSYVAQNSFKGDIDDYIYSWQNVKKVSER